MAIIDRFYANDHSRGRLTPGPQQSRTPLKMLQKVKKGVGKPNGLL